MDMRTSLYPRPTYGWYVVGVLLTCNLSCYVARMIILLLVQPIGHDLAVSDTAISLLQGAAFSVFFVLFGLPFGWLADRHGRRNILVAGVAIWSVMVIGCGLSTNFTQLFVARVGVGIGEAALLPAALSLMSDIIEPAHRGRAVAIFYTGALIGTGLATILGAWVYHALLSGLHIPLLIRLAPWQSLFCLAGLPGILATLLLFTVREPPRHQVQVPAAAGNRGSIFPFLKQNQRTVLPIYLTLTINQFCAFAVTGWIIPLLVRHFQFTTANAGATYGLAVIAIGFLAAGYVGFVGDRLARSLRRGGRMRVVMHSYVLFLPAVAILTLERSWVVAVAGLLLEVFAVCICAASMYTVIQDVFPNQLRGQASALLAMLVTLIGATLGPTAVALFTDYVFHDPAAVGYSILACTVPAALIGLVVTVLCLSEYSRSSRALVILESVARPAAIADVPTLAEKFS